VYREVAPLALGYETELLAALDATERAALDRALDALTATSPARCPRRRAPQARHAIALARRVELDFALR